MAAATWPPWWPVVSDYEKRSLTGALFAIGVEVAVPQARVFFAIHEP